MKKSTKNKIERLLTKNDIKLSYNTDNGSLMINGIKCTKHVVANAKWFNSIGEKYNDCLGLFVEYCIDNNLTISLKEKAKEEKEKAKEKAKEEKEKVKNEEREKAVEFKKNFDRWEVFDLLPRSQWKPWIRNEMQNVCGYYYKDLVDAMVVYKDLLIAKELERKQEERRKGNEDWYDKIDRNDKGVAKKTINNAMTFFENYPDYKEDDMFRWNEFSHLALMKKIKKGIREGDEDIIKYEPIETYDLTAMDLCMEKHLGFECLKWCEQSCDYLSQKHSYHPIKEAFERIHAKVKWDGKERLQDLFCLVGAQPTKLNRSMTKKLFYGMMKRIWVPGCKFDHMFILYDDTHGTGKTSIIESLFEVLGLPQEENGIVKVENAKNVDKDTIAVLNRCFIAVYDEMAGIIKSDPETLKAFITNTKDTVRLSYGRNVTNFLRHCVFYGSTNTKAFIKDTTDRYERRWWIIDCKGVRHENKAWWDEHFTVNDKLQIIAEMYEFFFNNPDYNYNELDEDEIEELIEVQRGHWTTENDSYTKMRLLEAMDVEVPDEFMVDFNHWRKFVSDEVDRLHYPTSYMSQVPSNVSSEGDENSGIVAKNSEKNDEKTSKNDEKTLKNEHKIPQNWVVWYAKEKYGKQLSPHYITRLVTPEYVKKDIKDKATGERYFYVKN